jgi:hypothetical protein
MADTRRRARTVQEAVASSKKHLDVVPSKDTGIVLEPKQYQLIMSYTLAICRCFHSRENNSRETGTVNSEPVLTNNHKHSLRPQDRLSERSNPRIPKSVGTPGKQRRTNLHEAGDQFKSQAPGDGPNADWLALPVRAT